MHIVYTDGQGFAEAFDSAATTLVTDGLTITGTGGNNTLGGGGGSDTINGLGGNDRLTGLGGNDTIDGGTGNDTLVATAHDGNDVYNGGGNTDTYDLSVTSAAATVNLGAGTASSAQTGSDTLASIENVVGSSGNDVLTGSTAANSLSGGGGNDLINGGGGSDVMTGGLGDDTYVTDGGDTISEAGGGGTDTVISSVTFTLGANLENLTLSGTGNINATGNNASNLFVGNAGNNVFNGNGGTDTVSYATAVAGVSVSLGTNGTQNTIGAGNDRLIGIANLIGSNSNDTLTGSNAANAITGGSGNDLLTGGGGNDTFVFKSTTDSGVGLGNTDVIADFQGAGANAGDRIDLSAIDADIGLVNDQAFSFVGNAVFSVAGQVRMEQVGGQTILQLNTDSNLATIEMEIRLTGALNLTAQNDFIF